MQRKSLNHQDQYQQFLYYSYQKLFQQKCQVHWWTVQVPCFRSAAWDAHPGSPEIQQCCSVSQQPWTGNQQMENELHICLEDICFGPAFTGLFLIIYLSPEKEKCFVQRLEANPANTEPKPQLDDGFLKSWTWCGMMGCSGSCSDIHPVYSEVLPLTQ